MCGGRGTRLDAAAEKPLLAVDGRPMVDRAIDALSAGDVGTVHAAVSPHTPSTAEHLRGRGGCRVIETPGEGYVADLAAALADPRLDRPACTCAADLPLLAGEHVGGALSAHAAAEAASLTVAVPAALKRALGVSVDTTTERRGRELAPAGLNVVGEGDDGTVSVRWDARLAVNVNRRSDAALAERLLGARN